MSSLSTERKSKPPLILTIGHSTRPIEEFIELLRQHGVERLVDIRTIPRSRHNPQFNGDALAHSLRGEHIEYAHLKELGGLRHPRPDSANLGWRNASFRGYADYMQTEEFEEAVQRLLQVCGEKQCAVMCAEAVPWRCHRSLLADALVARGIPVEHILGASRRDAHHLTPFAQIENGKVTYPKTEGKARQKAAAAGQTEPPAGQIELRFDESEQRDRGPAMARKNRKPKFTAAKEAKRRARLAAGTPPAARVIPDKRRKPTKHKPKLENLAENPE
jgi:Protein of unknown function, DUF488